MATEIHVEKDDHGDGRYSLLVDGKPAGEIEFRMSEGRRVFTHTGIRDEFEGQGLAGKIARRALDDSRADDVLVIPQCPYIESYIERHPDDGDLIDRAYWDELRGR
ncbi:MAG: GNAT family N-acetyltransferase [Aquihabitans sp.]